MSTAALSLNNDRVAPRKLLWAAPLAGLAAAAGNLAVFGLAKGLLALPLAMPAMGPNPAAPLGLAQVIIASILPALAAALLLALLGRFSRRPVRLFQIIAGVGLVLSLGAPLTLAADLATRLVLLSMHLVASLATTAVLSTFGTQPEPAVK